MCGLSIRRLTAAEREARDEFEGERYDALFAEIEGSERQAYDDEFGPIFKQRHPFKPDRAHIHEKVMARIRAEEI